MTLPAPEYDVDGITVYCGDALALLPMLRGRFSCIVADPPYGIGYRKGDGGSTKKWARRNLQTIDGDDVPFDPAPLLEWPCFLWGAQYYRTRLPAGGSFVTWDKSVGIGPADSFIDCDFAWCSVAGIKRNIIRHLWKGIACEKAGETNGRRWHPSQKPVAVMKFSIECMGLAPGDTVCDPYAGSGSTAIACRRLGFPCILIEKDPQYIPVIIRRLKEAETPLLTQMESSCPPSHASPQALPLGGA